MSQPRVTMFDETPAPKLPAEAATLEARTVSEAEARFERWRKISGAVLAPLGFFATWTLTAGALQPAGRNLAAVLVTVALLWMTELRWAGAKLAPARLAWCSSAWGGRFSEDMNRLRM